MVTDSGRKVTACLGGLAPGTVTPGVVVTAESNTMRHFGCQQLVKSSVGVKISNESKTKSKTKDSKVKCQNEESSLSRPIN